MNNMLSEQDTQAVLDILAKELAVQATQLTPDARIQADLGADSLTVMEITMAVEEHFGLSLPDEQWEKVLTVRDLFETLADVTKKPELWR